MERLLDFGDDAFGVLEDVVVPEAGDAPALGFQPGGSVFVCGWVCVLAAVGFDDQFGLDAGEVGDVGADWVLAAEFGAREGAGAEELPEVALGVGG